MALKIIVSVILGLLILLILILLVVLYASSKGERIIESSFHDRFQRKQ